MVLMVERYTHAVNLTCPHSLPDFYPGNSHWQPVSSPSLRFTHYYLIDFIWSVNHLLGTSWFGFSFRVKLPVHDDTESVFIFYLRNPPPPKKNHNIYIGKLSIKTDPDRALSPKKPHFSVALLWLTVSLSFILISGVLLKALLGLCTCLLVLLFSLYVSTWVWVLSSSHSMNETNMLLICACTHPPAFITVWGTLAASPPRFNYFNYLFCLLCTYSFDYYLFIYRSKWNYIL